MSQPSLAKMRKGIVYAISAAALFGASTPAAKALLGDTNPALLAGLLYFGSGVGLLAVLLVRWRNGKIEAPLVGKDWLWLSATTLFGGIIGPVLLMFGLARSTAATASLLLNLEAVATALIAWFVFREHTARRTVIGMALILFGGVALAWSGTPTMDTLLGPMAIAGACLAWGIDNNLTRNIASGDPVLIATIKSLIAGTVNTGLALFIAHSPAPPVGIVAAASLVGFLGYGLSLVLYILGLRELGSARTGAYFSTAPFIGATIAIAAGSAVLDIRFGLATFCMIAGVWLHVTEQHEHEHTHEALGHEHAHHHDEHHQHEHAADAPSGEPHTHHHRHERLVHAHAHFPDTDHRHAH